MLMEMADPDVLICVASSIAIVLAAIASRLHGRPEVEDGD
jgi:hypothetical protein